MSILSFLKIPFYSNDNLNEGEFIHNGKHKSIYDKDVKRYKLIDGSFIYIYGDKIVDFKIKDMIGRKVSDTLILSCTHIKEIEMISIYKCISVTDMDIDGIKVRVFKSRIGNIIYSTFISVYNKGVYDVSIYDVLDIPSAYRNLINISTLCAIELYTDRKFNKDRYNERYTQLVKFYKDRSIYVKQGTTLRYKDHIYILRSDTRIPIVCGKSIFEFVSNILNISVIYNGLLYYSDREVMNIKTILFYDYISRCNFKHNIHKGDMLIFDNTIFKSNTSMEVLDLGKINHKYNLSLSIMNKIILYDFYDSTLKYVSTNIDRDNIKFRKSQIVGPLDIYNADITRAMISNIKLNEKSIFKVYISDPMGDLRYIDIYYRPNYKCHHIYDISIPTHFDIHNCHINILTIFSLYEITRKRKYKELMDVYIEYTV